MDIEGGEYRVLEDILNGPIKIGQILVEFHGRHFQQGKSKTITAVKRLNRAGYNIFARSDNFKQVSFIHDSSSGKDSAKTGSMSG